MRKIMHPAIIAGIVCLSAFTLLLNTWHVKSDEAIIKFSSGKINGSFKGLKADIQFDKNQPQKAKIIASVEANSIATGFFLKNSHARNALGVDKYPAIRFVSTSVTKSSSAYIARGKLTLKGVTKPANIYFTFDDKGHQGVFKGSLKVVPREFGINRNGTPSQVMVYLTVPVAKS